jgi:hypothetical protein
MWFIGLSVLTFDSLFGTELDVFMANVFTSFVIPGRPDFSASLVLCICLEQLE